MDYSVIPAILTDDPDVAKQRVPFALGFFPVVQLDIMDGIFVPNTTLQYPEQFHLPTDKTKWAELHLMVTDPIKLATTWIDHSATRRILVHVEVIGMEVFTQLRKLTRERNIELGLAINPDTALESLGPYLDELDMVLVMGVHPGFSGQAFLPIALEKVRKLRKQRPLLPIEVDGGVNAESAPSLAEAGANVFAAASYLFKSPDIHTAAEQLLQKVKEVYTEK